MYARGSLQSVCRFNKYRSPEYSLARSVNPGYSHVWFFGEGYIQTYIFISRLVCVSDNNKGQRRRAGARVGAAVEWQMSF